MVKACFRCGEMKDLDEFYRHKEMADGHLNKCKECTKLDVKKNRADNSEYYKEFDRNRGNLPHRVQARAEYQKTDRGKERLLAGQQAWRKRNIEKSRAHVKAYRAKTAGAIVQQPCEVCGRDDTHAHHDDYSKPLEVRWLCPACHSAHHKNQRKA